MCLLGFVMFLDVLVNASGDPRRNERIIGFLEKQPKRTNYMVWIYLVRFCTYSSFINAHQVKSSFIYCFCCCYCFCVVLFFKYF